ncbi:ABC-2 transporter permease [Sporolactobacillus sp. THM7-7]|nr:ABC-2 transporter permease [Sporolactobacillus sp. THM7-7]
MSMFQLMMQDVYTQKKNAYFTPLFLLPLMLSNSGGVRIFGFFVIVGLLGYMMASYSHYGTEESDRMRHRLLLSLPVGRRSVVAAKYVMVGFWWMLAFVFGAILFSVVSVIFGDGVGLSFFPRSIIPSLCITYLFTSIDLPVYYKFGHKVSQIVGMALVFTSMIGFVTWVAQTRLLPVFLKQPVLFLVIVTLIVTTVSYFLSLRIFEKKNF